ncbi:unnamed protein product [Phyllotreta striolata]|uniref:alpha-glucosidase n=1 Tax=Phyllotreta striolata TaxID=444603 RepID=A0A9N9TDY7_PHYSR|nr:unnamed protein product [Phyllotreta striolata]
MRLLILTVLYLQCASAFFCSSLKDEDWWKTATFYQIFTKSFKDSNGDGIGDIQGILDKLDYIKNLGVTGVWLTSFFRSPEKDNGYDVSNHTDINPALGDLDTFQKFLNEAHKKRLKVIIDFIPNHTSDQHDWFNKSMNREDEYTDFYVWLKDDNTTGPPNNWVSNFNGSAWQWNDQRNQYYLHQFLPEQPDLNYRNNYVRNIMKDILTYWLKTQGVDGVRIGSVPYLIEEQVFKDEPVSKRHPNATESDYEYLNHVFTVNQPESYDLVYEWRAHVDKISSITGQTKICICEATQPTDKIIPYYGSRAGTKQGAHFAFNFILDLELKATSNAKDLANLIGEWLNKLPKIYVSNWVLGSHDFHRVATRLGRERVDLLNMLTGFLPGIQITYYGEEIGMEEVNECAQLHQSNASDCYVYKGDSRDPQRTPMQWDSSPLANFSDGKTTWLPVSYKKNQCNVKDQEEDPKSHLNVYRSVQNLRTQLRTQDQMEMKVLDKHNNILELTRYNKGESQGSRINVFIMVLNFGGEPVTVPLTADPPFKVMLRSGNSLRKCGEMIKAKILTMQPYEALILKPKYTSN